MRKLLVVLILTVGIAGLFAEGWSKSADVSLNMNQSSYSDNWSGEENGNINWVFNANLLAEKQVTEKLHNKNTLKLAYGQTYSQFVNEAGEREWGDPAKTTDLIDAESMARFTLGAFVDPFAAFRLESQFMDESVVDKEKMFNPVTLTESFGIARVFIKEDNKEFSARFGGAFKQFINSHAEEMMNDGGVEFVADYRTPLAKDRITYLSNLNIYKAMYYSESEVEGMTDDWKAPRVDWQNTFTASITKYLNVNLFIQLLYDKTDLDALGESIDEMQIKETLSLGLTYKLM
jgi:hypothetical protein